MSDVNIVIVGSGAGGATAARELAGLQGTRVTVLEAGPPFRAFTADRARLAALRGTGLYADERMITALFPAMRVTRAADGLRLVRGIASGGSTTLTTGSALRADAGLRRLGIDLGAELARLEHELRVTTAHDARWRESTWTLWEACRSAGLEPSPTPKMIDLHRCRRCGRCVLGCDAGAKWDARCFLDQAIDAGAALVTGARVERLVPREGSPRHARGVVVRQRGRARLLPADVVILAAGGLGTPAILSRSGLATRNRLHVDPVLCVAAPWPNAHQDRELPMPFIAAADGCLISPYFDHLSFFFDRRWRSSGSGIASLMIKLADQEVGDVGGGTVRKGLTRRDRERLRAAVALCRDVLTAAGAPRGQHFLGLPNAGHPGGMVPLDGGSAATLHHRSLPDNVYVADASLLPRSLGAPPSLTIMALAMRVAGAVRERMTD